MSAESRYAMVKIFGSSLLQVPPPEGKSNNHPFVKLLGKGWKVSVATRTGEGYVDFEKKVIHVPCDQSLCSERTRFHELAHVKWTPPIHLGDVAKEAKVPSSFVNAFEDCRVNTKLNAVDESFEDLLRDGKIRVTTDDAIYELERYSYIFDDDEDARKELQAAASAMYVCSRGYGEADELQPLLDAIGIPQAEIDKLVERVTNPDASFDDTIKASQELRDLIFGKKDPEGDPQPGEGGKPGEGDGQQQGEGAGTGQMQNDLEGQPAEQQPTEQQPGSGQESQAGIGQSAQPKPDLDAVDSAFAYTPQGGPSPRQYKPDKYSIPKKPTEPGKPGDMGGAPRKGGQEGSGMTHAISDDYEQIAYARNQGRLATPGVMQILRPPLAERITNKMHRPYIKKQDFEGGEIRSLHRLNTDSKVMRRKAPLRSRKRVGTLLIDASGSMSITVAQVTEILKEAPQVTVAVYSSNDLDRELWPNYHITIGKPRYNNTNEYSVGHLAIIAHRGKRITQDEIKPYLGGNNVVDTEAVRWLASQPRPRFWVCDLGVTGMQHVYGENILKDCLQTCKRAGIKRYPSVLEFMRDLQKSG